MPRLQLVYTTALTTCRAYVCYYKGDYETKKCNLAITYLTGERLTRASDSLRQDPTKTATVHDRRALLRTRFNNYSKLIYSESTSIACLYMRALCLVLL
jgi:hypothetical protein